MQIITISGVDGSGKSTQIKLLQNYLESQQKRVFYFHAIEFGIATKLAQFKKKYCLICKIKGMCDVKSESNPQSVTEANFLQVFLRRIFLLIDLMRFKSLRNKLHNKNFDYILSDRYFYDTIININYLSRKDKILPCEKLIPEPDKSFLLEINPQQIMQRERKPDQGLEYLQKKTILFKEKIADWNLQVIDGNQAKEVISAEIKNKL